MFQRKTRRFRRRHNDRGGFSHGNGKAQARIRPNSFSNGQSRNKFRPSLSAEKLFEKYNALAKEAMSSGDKTLSENYLQHADHFMRIIEDRNRNQNHRKPDLINKTNNETKQLSENNETNQSQVIDSNPANDNKE